MPALADHIEQFGSQQLQIRDLTFDICKMLSIDAVHRGTVAVALIGKVEKRANLLDQKAKIAAAPDETQSPAMVEGMVLKNENHDVADRIVVRVARFNHTEIIRPYGPMREAMASKRGDFDNLNYRAAIFTRLPGNCIRCNAATPAGGITVRNVRSSKSLVLGNIDQRIYAEVVNRNACCTP